ncbi:Crp/Fnr family transcriptional regulator [Sphingobacterium sp. N143]|uniref:Crp/Fnr family transcriptional regulator n=1 Tax=Sphingobacterium sp. N143 TaxID=2746727 RepID=UPI002575DD11|nr:Crp/Fnr family transcriptional regulator [Sphingobacterium sp. N143]MDM1296270.1 Crp/Fnr family transcriptional regulator [Sphingobacterium sp. N143]
MLRTNEKFLAYIQNLYDNQLRKEDVTIRYFEKGQKLLSQHEPATKVMLIHEGITKCYFMEANDKEYIVEFLGKGEILGEIESIRNIPCLCSIEALTDVSVFAISVPYFQQLLSQEITLNRLLIDVFSERIVNTSSRASFQQLYTVEHSLGKLLKLISRQKIQLSKDDIAAYLGISVRSLNRALKQINTTEHPDQLSSL